MNEAMTLHQNVLMLAAINWLIRIQYMPEQDDDEDNDDDDGDCDVDK